MDALLTSLSERVAAIADGAGRFYRVDALVGFLNVHREPDDPFRTDNVVARLSHGAIVEASAEEGEWVAHDGGGWSVRVYDGHEFLKPVE